MEDPSKEAIRTRFGSGVVEDFEKYIGLLIKWQSAQNLVSRETLGSLWERHLCDSARLFCVEGGANSWMDIGSGAGFPGLVTAILQKHSHPNDHHHVHLLESNGRKVAFLRAVIRELGLSASVHSTRIEAFEQWPKLQIDCVSARALASLGNLLALLDGKISPHTRLLFHKGRDIDGEISEAANSFDFEVIRYEQNFSDEIASDGLILEVRSVKKKPSDV